jgi:hypothetical protein
MKIMIYIIKMIYKNVNLHLKSFWGKALWLGIQNFSEPGSGKFSPGFGQQSAADKFSAGFINTAST